MFGEKDKGGKKQEQVATPDGAALQVDQDLYDAADPEGRLVATVHKAGKGAVGNVWYVPTQGGPVKLLPERELSGEPDGYMLVGEVNRFAQSKEKEIKEGDMRVKLGILGLHNAAMAVAEKSKK